MNDANPEKRGVPSYGSMKLNNFQKIIHWDLILSVHTTNWSSPSLLLVLNTVNTYPMILLVFIKMGKFLLIFLWGLFWMKTQSKTTYKAKIVDAKVGW